MSLEEDFELFLKALQNATSKIETHYFQLPVYGKVTPIYRERVYCYELYCHIRDFMVRNRNTFGNQYVLGGEVDKGGHVIRKECEKAVKPDLIVHIPGEMGYNLAVAEVKPITATKREICKDLETLHCFLSRANYFGAIYLVYGESKRAEKTFAKFERMTHEHLGDFDNNRVALIWHRKPQQSAFCCLY